MMLQTRPEKLWVAAGAVAALLLAALAYFCLISPKLASASSLASQNDAATLRNATLSAALDELRSEQAQMPKFQAELAAAQAALPADNGMSDFLRSMQSAGQATGVQVTSVAVATGGASAASTPSTHTSGVQTLPITISASGPDARLRSFLTQLQTVQPRAVVVTQAAVTGSVKGAGETLTLAMNAFVREGSS